MKDTLIIGIDLSGPRNIADSCVAVFHQRPESLCFQRATEGAGDRQVFDLISDVGRAHPVVVGLDAPLSYNPGGGDRPSDRALRRVTTAKGRVGVMPPTLIRMVYLTLRGMALTRALETLRPRMELRIVEVHPGASMLLHGAPPGDVTTFKRDAAARRSLLEWLQETHLENLPRDGQPTDHYVAACAAAAAAWHWSSGRAAWCHPAQPSEHPYDFAC